MKIIYTHTDEAPALATHSLLPIIAGVRRRRRRRGRAARHLARRPHPRPVPRPARRGAAGPRRARRARRARQDARGQHHQAAEHQRVGPAAEGGDRGAAGQGLRDPRLPGGAADDEERDDPRPLRRGQGQRGQPGAARGQLRPPRARLGEGVRAQAPALDGRVVAGLEDARRDDGRRRLPLHRAVGRPSPSATTTCASSTSPRTARSRCSRSRRRCSGRRGHRRGRHAPRALDAFLAAQIADAKEQGVLFSVHLKATMMKVSDPIIFGHAVRAFFAGRLRQARRRPRRGRLNPNDGLGACCRRSTSCRPSARDAIEPRRDGLAAGPAARDGRLRPRASPTCTCRAT